MVQVYRSFEICECITYIMRYKFANNYEDRITPFLMFIYKNDRFYFDVIIYFSQPPEKWEAPKHSVFECT